MRSRFFPFLLFLSFLLISNVSSETINILAAGIPLYSPLSTFDPFLDPQSASFSFNNPIVDEALIDSTTDPSTLQSYQPSIPLTPVPYLNLSQSSPSAEIGINSFGVNSTKNIDSSLNPNSQNIDNLLNSQLNDATNQGPSSIANQTNNASIDVNASKSTPTPTSSTISNSLPIKASDFRPISDYFDSNWIIARDYLYKQYPNLKGTTYVAINSQTIPQGIVYQGIFRASNKSLTEVEVLVDSSHTPSIAYYFSI